MRPGWDDFEDEIRGHLAISVQERIESGEDPETARGAALREFGNVLLTRESMQAVWRPRWLEMAATFRQDLRIALRSLARAKGLAVTVAVTLALGIGANAAVTSVVRQVLFRPLVHRDADRLIYVRQSAPGLGTENTTFSVPEIDDLRSGAKTISAFGDFSSINFAMTGLGEPRVVKAGVVGGSFFDVMGLRPALGRLLDAADDDPDAPPVAVLTHRFWSTSLDGDPAVIGQTVRLSSRSARVVGVLEPALPYPEDTEIIANVATSPHHLSATMVTERAHRMTELFGRLAPGATLEEARAELKAVHAAMLRKHPEAYPASADVQLSVTLLREQITAPARRILLLLLAAAAVVFVIACANVASLILGRAVRRERELGVRAALGAGSGALRRTLLAESLVLCAGGALLGLLLAGPLVTLLGRYAARFSVRALDVTVEPGLLWVGSGLAIAAAVVLAWVPRLPSPQTPSQFGPATGGLQITPGTKSRLRAFAITQVALSFVLLTVAGALLAALVALQTARMDVDTRQVLTLDVPLPLEAGAEASDFFWEATRRIGKLPGVEHVAVGNFVPWRDAGGLLPRIPFSVEGLTPAAGEEEPHARVRVVTPGFFAALGVPLVAGRDFTDEDGPDDEPVVIVSRSVAQRLSPTGEALDRLLRWDHPMLPEPHRIVGVVADVDDENIVPGPTLTVYHALRQAPFGGSLFVHATGDPYALVTPVTQIISDISEDQPVGSAATLADVRREVLAPERQNAFLVTGFAGVALLTAVVGVAGVLAVSVSARRRELGVRLAMGSTPRQLLTSVLSEGALIAALGILAGAAGGYALASVAAGSVESLRVAGALPLLGAAAVLMGAAVVASLVPAARAARVDVVQALQSE